MNEQNAESAIAAIAHKVTVGGGTAAVVGGWTANEIAAFGGLLIAFIGVLVQFYYKRKHDKREERIHAARMARLSDAADYGDGGF